MPSSADNPKGFRLLPDVLDRIGTATPDRIYASVPRSHDMRDGFRDLSCGQILRAVDSLALWILERHGKSEIFETLAYVGISDLRYAIVFFAAVKCGFKVLFISPRNALHQNVSLLEQTECSKLLHSPEFGLLADSIKQARLEAAVTITDVIAPLDHWIEKYTKPFPFQKTFEEAANDPLVVLHSSGSTGAN
ncbi:MAG: putative NRPS-like protein biosynthetic cluster [Bogoriella megaspora]|nr:MAG: putative NRPS-like protein biosynthetic cluster [Bogoriella megaspora]